MKRSDPIKELGESWPAKHQATSQMVQEARKKLQPIELLNKMPLFDYEFMNFYLKYVLTTVSCLKYIFIAQ